MNFIDAMTTFSYVELLGTPFQEFVTLTKAMPDHQKKKKIGHNVRLELANIILSLVHYKLIVFYLKCVANKLPISFLDRACSLSTRSPTRAKAIRVA